MKTLLIVLFTTVISFANDIIPSTDTNTLTQDDTISLLQSENLNLKIVNQSQSKLIDMLKSQSEFLQIQNQVQSSGSKLQDLKISLSKKCVSGKLTENYTCVPTTPEPKP